MSMMRGCTGDTGAAFSGKVCLTVGEKISYPMGVVTLFLIFRRFWTTLVLELSVWAFDTVRNLSIAVNTRVRDKWKTL